jgi:bifunctional non-homologous end joining protein LigD
MLFKRASPRRVRTPPTGFVRPAQPTLVGKPPAGPDWLHEVKHDGYRLVALKDGARAKLWSRRGTNFTDRFPQIAEAVRGLPAERALVDGEAVAFRPDAPPPFDPGSRSCVTRGPPALTVEPFDGDSAPARFQVKCAGRRDLARPRVYRLS